MKWTSLKENKINIRPYTYKDRQALRTLCCDVADRGERIENFFPDRDWAADILTSYYTDYEPQSTFVAEEHGRLVGYINGCMDNRRYGLVMAWILLPWALIKGFKRGVFFRREIILLFQGALKNWRRLFFFRQDSFSSHQGHLHIGIAPEARRQQTGKQLMASLLALAQSQGLSELTASVHEHNKGAVHFFEAQGFVVRHQYPMIMIRQHQEVHYHSLLYVKTIQ